MLNSALYKKYSSLSPEEKAAIDVLVLIYSGLFRFHYVEKYLQLWGIKFSIKEKKSILENLLKSGLIILVKDHYYVDLQLRVFLLPILLKEPKYKKLAKEIVSTDFCNRWEDSSLTKLRNYVIFSFLGEAFFENLIVYDDSFRKNPYVYENVLEMFSTPEYDEVLTTSKPVFSSILENIASFTFFNFKNINLLADYFDRVGLKKSPNGWFLGYNHKVSLFNGDFNKLPKVTDDDVDNCSDLIVLSQAALFKGEFIKSIELFELARNIDDNGLKCRKQFFPVFDEYFYWLNFLFAPEAVNVKMVNAFVVKALKNGDDKYAYILPLLYVVLNDYTSAENSLKYFYLFDKENKATINILSLLHFFNRFIVLGELNDSSVELGVSLLAQFQKTKIWLFANEVAAILNHHKKGLVKDFNAPNSFILKPIFVNKLKRVEKWEQRLDGLLTMLSGEKVVEEKTASVSRVVYFLNMNINHIQPVLQTRKSSGAWSNGRNISLRKFKTLMVDGLSEQDRRVAATVRIGYGYSNSEYIDFEHTVPHLCGHPYLFLESNPSVSVELIAAQPEIITEETAKGIRLKTNVSKASTSVVIIKETQTRYKVISISNSQRKAIELLSEGVLIPNSGKGKMMKVLERISGIMSVQSDLVETSGEAKEINADSKIRIQIIPMGEGLKAEMFVKPLSTEPPYLKPGVGGKVIYGTVNGEKCRTIRNLEEETQFAKTFNNELTKELDVDLINDVAFFDSPQDSLFLLEVISRNSDFVIVEWPEGEQFKLSKQVSFDNFKLRVKSGNNWFDIDGELNVDENTVLSLKELLVASSKSNIRFIEMRKGQFVSLSNEFKKQLEELNAFVTIDKQGVKLNKFAAHAVENIAQNASSFKSDKKWKEFQKRITDSTEIDVSIPTTLEAELRSYQQEGYAWMARLSAWGAGACLADDMGLGKTIQAIAMMISKAENGASLVVCPASLVSNWISEINRFAPTLNPVVLKPGNRKDTFSALGAFDVLIITYGLLNNESKIIASNNWSMAVLDEAHAIKNTSTKASKAAMEICADFKLVLTGTPVQNHPGELWNLFNFCNPGLLGTLPAFTDRYVKNETEFSKKHLKKLISPFILRRSKNKVLDELPSKTEITLSVELSDEEMAFYEALRQSAIENIENNDEAKGQQHLQALAEITRLRLACCNTSLVNKTVKLQSSKLNALLEIVAELRENNHRALIFSQFVGHLAIVRDALDKEGVHYQYLDGSTSLPDREKAVKAFQGGQGDLFLISLKAGGLGLNLTGADYVVHLDPWWNPAIEDQASDRAHRMGQTRPVTIYRLVAKNTIEEKIVKLHATKRNMAENLLDGTDKSTKISTADLLDLLKSNF